MKQRGLQRVLVGNLWMAMTHFATSFKIMVGPVPLSRVRFWNAVEILTRDGQKNWKTEKDSFFASYHARGTVEITGHCFRFRELFWILRLMFLFDGFSAWLPPPPPPPSPVSFSSELALAVFTSSHHPRLDGRHHPPPPHQQHYPDHHHQTNLLHQPALHNPGFGLSAKAQRAGGMPKAVKYDKLQTVFQTLIIG